MFVSILTDIIGVAITAAVEVPFRSMAAKKVKGSKESIILINLTTKCCLMQVLYLMIKPLVY